MCHNVYRQQTTLCILLWGYKKRHTLVSSNVLNLKKHWIVFFIIIMFELLAINFGKICPCHFYHVLIQNNSTDVIFFWCRISLALITYYLISVLLPSLKTTITYVIQWAVIFDSKWYLTLIEIGWLSVFSRILEKSHNLTNNVT